MENLEIVASEASYPTNFVGWSYSLLGGATGGLIVGMLFIINMQSIEAFIWVTLIFVMFGSMLGLIPAVITGIWIAKNKISIKFFEDYNRLFNIGFLISSIYAALVTTITSIYMLYYSDNISFGNVVTGLLIILLVAAGIGLLGGLSSMLLGKLILPKVPAQKASIQEYSIQKISAQEYSIQKYPIQDDLPK